MERKTVTIVPTMAVLNSLLGGLGGTPPMSAIFTSCKVKLFVGATEPTNASALVDFTETDAAGYTEQTISAWSGPLNTDGSKRGYAAEPIFVFGDNEPDGKTINGYYIVNNAEDTLLAAERFSTPLQVIYSGDALLLDVYLMLPNTWASGA